MNLRKAISLPLAVAFALLAGCANDAPQPPDLTLDGWSWVWTKTTYNNDTEITPRDPAAFTATFIEDGHFQATTDCNSLRGTYELDGNKLIFGQMASTRMACPDSQEQAFTGMLAEVQTHLLTDAGQLVLALKYDTGSMVFEVVE